MEMAGFFTGHFFLILSDVELMATLQEWSSHLNPGSIYGKNLQAGGHGGHCKSRE